MKAALVWAFIEDLVTGFQKVYMFKAATRQMLGKGDYGSESPWTFMEEPLGNKDLAHYVEEQ